MRTTLIKSLMVLRVGTDYSGIETPLMALDKIGIPYKHVFSSEIDPTARQVIQEKFKPDILYGDATKRDNSKLPNVDLYIAGFPCQAFSSMRQDLYSSTSTKIKLKHFKTCIKAIKASNPGVFVLENVPRLMSANGGKVLELIKRDLSSLHTYHISILKLNALNFGSLQNRSRLFIIGIKSNLTENPITRIQPIRNQKTPSFEHDIMEPDAKRRTMSPKYQKIFDKCARESPHKPFRTHLNFNTSGECKMTQFIPCLLASGSGFYWSPKKLLSTVREEARVQGIPDTFVFPESISDTLRRKLIGNAMSVDCLSALFASIRHHIRETKSD